MLLAKAIDISYYAHKGQFDKAGNPYVSHPIYVAGKMKTNDEIIVALLHDVIEDTDLTLDYLIEEGYPDNIIKAIDAITRRPEEDYGHYIKRVKENPLAKCIKIEDLKHNMDLRRIKNPTDSDFQRVERYRLAMEILLGE